MNHNQIWHAFVFDNLECQSGSCTQPPPHPSSLLPQLVYIPQLVSLKVSNIRYQISCGKSHKNQHECFCNTADAIFATLQIHMKRESGVKYVSIDYGDIIIFYNLFTFPVTSRVCFKEY